MSQTRRKTIALNRSHLAAAPERIVDPEKFNAALNVDDLRRANRKIEEISQLLWLPETLSEAEIDARLARAIELYESLAPSNGGEAMLAQQMVGTHHAAMECLRRANLPGQSFEGRDMELKHAAKLMALYERQLGTLQKSKGKGQQTVTVEHVHVAAGGQAIVGHVETSGSTSGGRAAIEEKRAVPMNAPPETAPPETAPASRRKCER